MSSRRSVMTTRESATLRRPKSVRNRSCVSGRGGVAPWSGTAIPVASARPIAIASDRLSRLPCSSTVGCCVRWSISTATTSTSCGPVTFGGPTSGGSGARDARSGAPSSARLNSAISPTRQLIMPATPFPLRLYRVYRRRRVLREGAEEQGPSRPPPTISGVVELEAQREPREQQRRQQRPHERVADAVRDVAEHDRTGRLAREEDGAEDPDDDAAALGGRLVGDERRESRVEEPVGPTREEAGQEEHGHHRRLARPGDEKPHAGQERRGDRLHEHGRDDDGSAAAGVDEPSAEDAHADRGQRVRRVEEGERLDAEALRERRQKHEDRSGAEPEEDGHPHAEAEDLAERPAFPEKPLDRAWRRAPLLAQA